MPYTKPSADEIKSLFANIKTIAVVGASSKVGTIDRNWRSLSTASL